MVIKMPWIIKCNSNLPREYSSEITNIEGNVYDTLDEALDALPDNIVYDDFLPSDKVLRLYPKFLTKEDIEKDVEGYWNVGTIEEID